MTPGMQFTRVNQLLKDLTGSRHSIGGKPVLFGGDIRQVPLVVRRGTRNDIVRTCIKYNPVRREMVQFRLTANMRVRGDGDYSDWLLQRYFATGGRQLTQLCQYSAPLHL